MGRYLLTCLCIALFAGEVAAAPVSLRILHINDFHGFANPTRSSSSTPTLGGAARLARLIESKRQQHNVLLLVAGDVIQGDTWTNLTQGKGAIELMNLLEVDAMVTGNHEFDFGQEVLKKRIAEANFPILAANLSGLPGVQPRVYFNRNGLRVSVIGLVTDETPQTTHPRNTAGLSFASPLETAKEQIAEAELTSDLIILLTHIGFEQDRALAEELCNRPSQASDPIVIIGGHTHTRLEQPLRIGNCVIVQAWEHGKSLGVLDLTLERGKLLSVNGSLTDVTPALGPGAPAAARLVESHNQAAKELLGRKLTTSTVDLTQLGVRRQETNLGNLVADVVRKATGAEVALVNGGSIRTGIPKGEITARQIHAALPFNNYLVAVRMTGRQLLQALEHGVSAVEQKEGRFPQISGVSFSYTLNREPGRRVLTAQVNGEPLQPEREYRVATLDFIAAGGDGYRAFGEAIRDSGDFSEVAGAMKSSRLVYNDPGRYLRDIVMEELGTRVTIAPRTEGRIREVR